MILEKMNDIKCLKSLREFTDKCTVINDKIKELKSELRKLEINLFKDFGFEFGDLCTFTEEYKKEHKWIFDSYQFYIVGLVLDRDIVYAVCSFKKPTRNKFTKAGQWVDIRTIVKVK